MQGLLGMGWDGQRQHVPQGCRNPFGEGWGGCEPCAVQDPLCFCRGWSCSCWGGSDSSDILGVLCA